MDWKKIKTEAKEKIKGKLWDVWKPTIVIGIISAVIGALATAIFGANTTSAQIVTSIFSLLLVPAEVGYILYMLKFVRGENYDLTDLKAFYNKFWSIILINVLVTIFVTLGMIALIIPGIILAFAYTMVYYIFADNPEIESKQCLDESKEMMKGYKMNYFGFALSFFGWMLLCAFVIPMIWVIPYITTSQTLYYEELKKMKESEK